MIYIAQIESPLGTIKIQSTVNEIIGIDFIEEMEIYQSATLPDVLTECKKQVSAYFQGKSRHFTVPFNGSGTVFQLRVWKALETIPYGKTVSYLQIAKQIGNPHSVRAVANAIGKNPLAIIVPCHRVIGINGKLTGYAGGIWRKKWLLELEGIKILD